MKLLTTSDISLLRIKGNDFFNNQLISRIFGVLGDNHIQVLITTKDSSKDNLCFYVLTETVGKAETLIKNEIHQEIKDGTISNINSEKDLSLIILENEGAQETSKISGKLFQSLAKNGISIQAIAEGFSESDLSFVVKKIDLPKAVNVLNNIFSLKEEKELNVFLVGPGLVGSALINYIKNKSDFLRDKLYIKVNLIGLANSKKMAFNTNGIGYDNWKNVLEFSADKSNLSEFVSKTKSLNLANSVFIDCTATNAVLKFYNEILSANISVITPNKIANTLDYDFYNKLRKTAKEHNVQFRYSTNVGAGLPMIEIVKDLTDSGERIKRIEAVLSGSLSYIFNSFHEQERSFTEIVLDAQQNGFTEPDPRDDLQGTDMARKILILAREMGERIEFDDIEIENLVPQNARECSVGNFFEILKKEDHKFEQRKLSAAEHNKRLIYIATYNNGSINVELKEVDTAHPFYNLKGTENIISIETENHMENPLVIKGKGAGATYTAFGIFSDLIRVSKYLM